MFTTKSKQGTNLEDVQELNRSVILRLIRKLQLCSRAELAEISGLNQSTITHIINEFIVSGLVEETGIVDGKKGRRSIGIQLNRQKFRVIGIRITHKSISIGVYDLAGNEMDNKQITLANRDSATTRFNHMKKLIIEMQQLHAASQVVAIGIAAPESLFFEDNQGQLNGLSGWAKVNPIQDKLKKEFGIPVYIEHDVKAGALADWRFNEQQHENVTIYVEVGQFVRAGVAMNGRANLSSHDRVSDFGHMSIDYQGHDCECGQRGCLQQYCSTVALLQLLNKEHTSLKSVWKDLKDNDSATIEAVRQIGWFLGVGLVNLINLYQPDRILIGGELSAGGDIFMHAVKRSIQDHVRLSMASRLTLLLASVEQDDMLVGAATIATNQLLDQPSSYLSLN